VHNIAVKKTSISENAPTREQLLDAIRQCRSARLRDRLRGVLWLQEGVSVREVATRLHVGRNTPTRWVHQVNQLGIGGLADRHRPGRPPRLTPEHIEQLRVAIAGPPVQNGINEPEWNSRALAAFLTNTWGITYGKSQLHRLLARFKD
jgi:transposase